MRKVAFFTSLVCILVLLIFFLNPSRVEFRRLHNKYEELFASGKNFEIIEQGAKSCISNHYNFIQEFVDEQSYPFRKVFSNMSLWDDTGAPIRILFIYVDKIFIFSYKSMTREELNLDSFSFKCNASFKIDFINNLPYLRRE